MGGTGRGRLNPLLSGYCLETKHYWEVFQFVLFYFILVYFVSPFCYYCLPEGIVIETVAHCVMCFSTFRSTEQFEGKTSGG